MQTNIVVLLDAIGLLLRNIVEFSILYLKQINQLTQTRSFLSAEGYGDDALMAIARFAEGGLRDALQLLGQVSLLGEAVTANPVIEMTLRDFEKIGLYWFQPSLL